MTPADRAATRTDLMTEMGRTVTTRQTTGVLTIRITARPPMPVLEVTDGSR